MAEDDVEVVSGEVVVLDRAPVTLPPVQSFITSSAPIVQQVATLAVKDDEDERAATDVLTDIKRALTGAEAARKALVGPVKTYAKGIDDVFKEHRRPLEEAETTLKRRILSYRQQVERERQAEIQRQLAEQRAREEAEQRQRDEEAALAREQMEAEAAASETPQAALPVEEAPPIPTPAPVAAPQPLDLPPARPSVTRTAGGSAQTRKRWKFEVVDPMQVPRQYLMVDDRLLRAAVSDGEREIPGVRIFQEDDLAVRAR